MSKGKSIDKIIGMKVVGEFLVNKILLMQRSYCYVLLTTFYPLCTMTCRKRNGFSEIRQMDGNLYE